MDAFEDALHEVERELADWMRANANGTGRLMVEWCNATRYGANQGAGAELAERIAARTGLRLGSDGYWVGIIYNG